MRRGITRESSSLERKDACRQCFRREIGSQEKHLACLRYGEGLLEERPLLCWRGCGSSHTQEGMWHARQRESKQEEAVRATVEIVPGESSARFEHMHEWRARLTYPGTQELWSELLCVWFFSLDVVSFNWWYFGVTFLYVLYIAQITDSKTDNFSKSIIEMLFKWVDNKNLVVNTYRKKHSFTKSRMSLLGQRLPFVSILVLLMCFLSSLFSLV